MAALMRGKDSSRCLLLLAAVLMVESSQLGSSRAKLNSIKSSLGGETPAQAANRSAGTYQGLAFGGSKKGKNLGQVGKHSKYTLQPTAVGTSALERVVCLCTPQPFKCAPHVWARTTAGEGFPEADLRGCGWLVTAGAGGGAWSGRVGVLPPLFGYLGRYKIQIQCVPVGNGPSPNDHGNADDNVNSKLTHSKDSVSGTILSAYLYLIFPTL